MLHAKRTPKKGEDMSKQKVKLFSDWNQEIIEEQINGWLSIYEEHLVKEIKVSKCVSENGYPEHRFFAYIVYVPYGNLPKDRP